MKYIPSARLLEADVSRQVKDFMEWRGWRAVRNNVSKFPDGGGRWVQLNEPGVPDFQFIRYLNTEFSGLAVVCWIEVKRAQRGKLSADQKKWRDREHARGAVVLKASDIRDFEAVYYETFGWLHRETWVGGQQELGLKEVGKSRCMEFTKSADQVTK